VNFIIDEGRRPVRTEVDPGCDLVEVVEERAAFWRALGDEQGRSFSVTVTVDRAAVAVPRVDAVAMVDALIENGFAHTDEHVPLAIGLGRAAERLFRLEVEDGGLGIANPDAVDRGASTGDSSGLGLDIARRTAEASGGSLDIGRSRLMGGARVVVTLPER
jgi:signal transduction histidine kinase